MFRNICNLVVSDKCEKCVLFEPDEEHSWTGACSLSFKLKNVYELVETSVSGGAEELGKEVSRISYSDLKAMLVVSVMELAAAHHLLSENQEEQGQA